MPRLAWSRLLILLIALPLASCFKADDPCPTCPHDDSGRIDVQLPQLGDVDSIHVTVDSGTRITVRRGKRGSVGGLAAGIHSVKLVRWYEDFGIITTKTSVVEVQLDRGELRLITFQNDFTLISDATPFGLAPRAPAPRPFHDGWARA